MGSVINPNGFPKEGKILIPRGMYKDKSEESDKKKLKYQSNREEIPTLFSSEQGNPECMYDQNISNRGEIRTLFSYEQENPQSG